MRPKLVLASCALFFTDFRPVLNFFPKNGAVFYCRRFQAFYLGLPFDGGTFFAFAKVNRMARGRPLAVFIINPLRQVILPQTAPHLFWKCTTRERIAGKY
jgi:hypothetical protein